MTTSPTTPRRLLLAGLLAGSLSMSTLAAQAAEPLREHQVNLSASASAELPFDTLGVSLRVQREGPDAAALQQQLQQVLEGALAEARRETARGAGVEVSSGGFQIGARYGRDGKLNGWSGSAELLVKGQDLARVAALAARLPGLTVAGVQYSLSPAARERGERELGAQAIRKFRARAGEVAQQFGYRDYTLLEAQLQTIDEQPGQRVPVFAMKAAAPMAEAAPLPVEVGKGLLSVTVQGAVRLER